MSNKNIVIGVLVIIVIMLTTTMIFMKMDKDRIQQMLLEEESINEQHVEEIKNLIDKHTKLINSVDILEDKVEEYSEVIKSLEEQTEKYKKKLEDIQDSINSYDIFEVTAYDNSPQSQGKWVDQTATGVSVKGETLESCMCVAVDPKVIPLNSHIEIIFKDEYKHLSGTYKAIDTGGAIKGNRIDLFMGDGVSKSKVFDFGRRNAYVRILD